ncbi:hypothetical protein ABZ901_07600 [Actinacidiphila alni]|uniref:hypothetical protein n=1 Tax=Actinacidiphila alni TaxID=380248 RepID=UPI0033FA7584
MGRGRQWSLRDFAARAVDPVTGWAPSKSLLGKIVGGESYKIEPRLVSALAVGLGLPRQVVAAAAHWQAIGYEQQELGSPVTTMLVRYLSSPQASTALAQAVAERWDAEERNSGRRTSD